MLGKRVHRAFDPVKLVFALLRLAKSPGEFPYADDIHPCLRHQLRINLPTRFRLLLTPIERKNPMFRIIIGTKIHKSNLLRLEVKR